MLMRPSPSAPWLPYVLFGRQVEGEVVVVTVYLIVLLVVVVVVVLYRCIFTVHAHHCLVHL